MSPHANTHPEWLSDDQKRALEIDTIQQINKYYSRLANPVQAKISDALNVIVILALLIIFGIGAIASIFPN